MENSLKIILSQFVKNGKVLKSHKSEVNHGHYASALFWKKTVKYIIPAKQKNRKKSYHMNEIEMTEERLKIFIDFYKYTQQITFIHPLTGKPNLLRWEKN